MMLRLLALGCGVWLWGRGASAACGDHDGMTCDACLRDQCSWCHIDRKCTNDLTASCGREAGLGLGAWVKSPLGCKDYEPLKGNWSGEGRVIKGCTNPNAVNYRFMATKDDGSCEYPPAAHPFNGEPQRCICSDAGDGPISALSTPYGRFCGAGYGGAPGQQPCDRLDKCCQMYDWCVGQYGRVDCKCRLSFRTCIEELRDDKGFCGHLDRAAGTILSALSLDISCKGPPTQAMCNASANCPHGGQCTYTGQCLCQGRHAGYDCEECTPGWYPPGRCDATCSPKDTCSDRGQCNTQGKCVCGGFWYGAHCTHDGLPLFLTMLLCVVGIMLCGMGLIGGMRDCWARWPLGLARRSRRFDGRWDSVVDDDWRPPASQRAAQGAQRVPLLHAEGGEDRASPTPSDDLLGSDFSLEDILADGGAPSVPTPALAPVGTIVLNAGTKLEAPAAPARAASLPPAPPPPSSLSGAHPPDPPSGPNPPDRPPL